MSTHLKIYILLLLFPATITSLNAQNLLDLNGWTIGSGSTGVFDQNGISSENTREWGEGPNGNRVVVWKASPDGTAEADGGFNSGYIAIDHTKMYRFSIWIKKTNSVDGFSYFGCGAVLTLAGVLNTNPYFWYGKFPGLNKWYLLVGYIHGSGDASTTNLGAIYDGSTGAKIQNIEDFKFSTTSTHTNQRSYLFYDPNTNDRQYFYAPRIEVVNGNEPSVATLLGFLPSSSSDQTYFSGKVGIKTANPGDYDLAVNGKIRSQEVKVENANWPDYVFEKKYELPTLQSTEQHIKEKGYLPGIPSAEEVKANGVNISEMNAKLLQKIEELTLYIINQEKRIKLLEECKIRKSK